MKVNSNGILEGVNIPGVKFVVDIIPKGRKRRPGIKMQPRFITIHNTGCNEVPADNFRRSQLDPMQDKEVSWHFTIDEKTIVQHLPITEVAWHAGDGHRSGNMLSIGIETCERAGAEDVVILFTAELMKVIEIGMDRVEPHKKWSGKTCPWLILPHWEKFMNRVEVAYSKDEELERALDVLVTEDAKISACNWNRLSNMNMKYAEALVLKLGAKFGKSTYKECIDYFESKGAIKTRIVWDNKKFKPEWCRTLIINISKI